MQSPRRRSVDLEAGFAGDEGVTQEMAVFHDGGVVTESRNPFRRFRVNGFSFRICFCQKRCRYPHAFVFFCFCCRVLCLRLLQQGVLRLCWILKRIVFPLFSCWNWNPRWVWWHQTGGICFFHLSWWWSTCSEALWWGKLLTIHYFYPVSVLLLFTYWVRFVLYRLQDYHVCCSLI